MAIRWRATVLVAWTAAGSVQASDLPGSPECLAALDRLWAMEQAAMPATGSSEAPANPPSRPAAALQAARGAAAQACLGAGEDEPPHRRADHSPTLLAPERNSAPSTTRQLPAAAVALPPIDISRPKTVTSCDLAGCWMSDGTRLQRAGEGLLFGPKGFCTLQGTTVFCP